MSTVTVSTRKSAKVKRSRYTPVSDLPSAATCTDSDSTATRTGTDNYWNWPSAATRTGTDNYWNWPSAATRTDSDDYRIGLNPRPIRVGSDWILDQFDHSLTILNHSGRLVPILISGSFYLSEDYRISPPRRVQDPAFLKQGRSQKSSILLCTCYVPVMY